MRLGLVSTGILVACGIVGCNGGADGPGALTFTNDNNYLFSNSIAMNQVDVQPQTDLTIDWSGLTTDVRERPVDPATVEEISLLKFSYPLDELVDLFGKNEIDAQAEATETYLFTNSGVTSSQATEFEITGVGFVPADLLVEDPNSTWTVSAVNYPGGRLDLLMSVALRPVSTSTNTTVELKDGDTQITIDQLQLKTQPLSTTAGEDSYSLDWSAVKNDVFGHPFDSIAGDELLIGHFDGTVEDVEANFLQLDTYAEAIYRTSVLGETAVGDEDGEDLSEAVDENGNPFGGFTTDGTWLIGISCTTCSTPVPLLLTVVEVQ